MINLIETAGVVFIILKLLEMIDWSWWLVTAPFTVPAILYIIIIALAKRYA